MIALSQPSIKADAAIRTPSDWESSPPTKDLIRATAPAPGDVKFTLDSVVNPVFLFISSAS